MADTRDDVSRIDAEGIPLLPDLPASFHQPLAFEASQSIARSSSSSAVIQPTPITIRHSINDLMSASDTYDETATEHLHQQVKKTNNQVPLPVSILPEGKEEEIDDHPYSSAHGLHTYGLSYSYLPPPPHPSHHQLASPPLTSPIPSPNQLRAPPARHALKKYATLGAVDELSAAPLTRSASLTSRTPPPTISVNGTDDEQQHQQSSPIRLKRSLSHQQHPVSASTVYHSSRPNGSDRSFRNNELRSGQLSLLTNQLRLVPDASSSSASPPSPLSAPFRSMLPHSSSSSSTPITQGHRSTASHGTTPNGSRPPSPRSARVLQSIRDSLTSSLNHSQNAHSYSHSGLNEEKESFSRSHSLQHAHSLQLPVHSSSLPQSHPPRSNGGSFSCESGSISTLHQNHESSSSTFDDTIPDHALPLTRTPSNVSSSAPTQTHSPVSTSAISDHSHIPAFQWNAPAAETTNRELTSYLFEPQRSPSFNQASQSSHGDLMMSIPWQPMSSNRHVITELETKEDDETAASNPPSHSSSASYCAVCLSDGADAFLLPCNHNFHAACILKWVESDHQQPQHRLSCPLCRQSIQQFVPIDNQIEDENGDLLARFLRVWEKHYYSAPQDETSQPHQGGGEDGEQLIKPSTTQMDDYPQKPQQQQQQQLVPVQEHPQEQQSLVEGTTTEPTESNPELTPEQRAWQQMLHDVYFIPDTLPDDFIIPSARPLEPHEMPPIFRQPISSSSSMPDWNDHAANIAAIDGGIVHNVTSSAASILNVVQNPFALLNSLYTAFRGGLRAITEQLTPPAVTFPNRRAHSGPINHTQRQHAEELKKLRHRQELQRSHTTKRNNRSTQAESVAEAGETQSLVDQLLHDAHTHQHPPTPNLEEFYHPSAAASHHHYQHIQPAPAHTPILAGASAGGVGTIVQQLSHSGGRAFGPSPISTSMPAVAAYFTSYEMMKAELGLSPSLNHDDLDEDGQPRDPRANLLTPYHTAAYFGAASSGAAVSQIVKMALTPGVLSLASAFASTAQISARMGIQFSVYEQAKNAFALYRHKRVGEELNAGEVLVAASLGGVVAATMMYPIQHLLPTHQWGLTAPPPSAPTTAASSGPMGAIPKPTLTACLGRFLPACVATAVTYEFAYRAIRNHHSHNNTTPHQYQHHITHGTNGLSLPAPSSSTSSEPDMLVGQIADRTSNILSSVGLPTSHEEIMSHIPIREPNSRSRTQSTENCGMVRHTQTHNNTSVASSSSSSSFSVNHPSSTTLTTPSLLTAFPVPSSVALPSSHSYRSIIGSPAPVHNATTSSASSSTTSRFTSTLQLPSTMVSGPSQITRSRSHPSLVSQLPTTTTRPTNINSNTNTAVSSSSSSSLLDPW